MIDLTALQWGIVELLDSLHFGRFRLTDKWAVVHEEEDVDRRGCQCVRGTVLIPLSEVRAVVVVGGKTELDIEVQRTKVRPDVSHSPEVG